MTITHKLLPDLPPCICGAFAQLTTEVTPGSYIVECSDYDCQRDGCTSGMFETAEAAIKTWLLFHPVKVAEAQMSNVKVIWKSDEYIRRNVIHAASLGAVTDLKHVRERLSRMKNRPFWLAEALANIQKRINLLPPELEAYRDEAQP